MQLSLTRFAWDVTGAQMAIGAAVSAGLAFGFVLAAGPSLSDPALMTLLRFMAVMKAALALAASGALLWRLRRTVRPGVALAYAMAAGCLMAGPMPIWAGTHVALGAVLVHGGLVVGALTAWRDWSGWRRA